LTVADGCLDAPCHRMKRLESWLVFIDAEHLASDPGIRSWHQKAWHQIITMPLHITKFSRFRNFIGHIRHQFRSGRLVGACRNRNFTI
jgi:hypothetical protein